MAVEDSRPEAKSLFVSKHIKQRHKGKRPSQYDIAVMAPGDKYVEYDVMVIPGGITVDVANRLGQLFGAWRITGRTLVCVSEDVRDDDPVKVYLQILGRHLGFSVYRVRLSVVVNRILSKYPGLLPPPRTLPNRKHREYKDHRKLIQRVWRGFVKAGICPWITEDYDRNMRRDLTQYKAYKKQLLRISAFYMLVRLSQKRKRDRHKARVRESLAAQPVRQTGIFSP